MTGSIFRRAELGENFNGPLYLNRLAYTHRNLRKAKIFQLVENTA
jgi:hypothetical protein